MANSTKTMVEEIVGDGCSPTAYSNYCQMKNSLSVNQKSISYRDDSKDDGCGRTDSEVKDQGILLKMFQARCCKSADVIITVLIIVLIWMLMGMPTVIFVYKKVVRPG